MTFPSRFTRLEAARARFGDRVDRLGRFLTRGDPLADDVAASIDANESGRASWELFERAARSGVGSLADAPPSFRAFFDSVERVPLWVDWDIVDRGGEVLLRAGALGGIVLGCYSLVLGYASPGGNKPLVLSGRLEQQAARRLNETAQFVRTTIARGSMHPHGEGWQSALRVRLVHAHVRRMIGRTGLWNDAWGTPINQHDEAGTSLLFSVAVLGGLRRLGVRIAPEEAERYVQLWRWTAWLMGVDAELLPASEAEGERLGALITATQGDPDDDSRRLTRALLEAPLGAATSAGGRHRAHRIMAMSAAICRALLEDDLADRLAVPKTGARHAVPLIRRLVSGAEHARERVPFGNAAAFWAGKRYWERVVERGYSAPPLFMQPQVLQRSTPSNGARSSLLR
jgi:hypothetical protein